MLYILIKNNAYLTNVGEMYEYFKCTFKNKFKRIDFSNAWTRAF